MKDKNKTKEISQIYKTIFDNAKDGILIADIENKKFHMGNNMICEILGYSPEEIRNIGVMDIHPEKDLPYVIEEFEKQSRKEIGLARDIPVKRKDGSIFYADINSFPILSGKPYLVGIFRDSTDRKRAEEVLRESEGKYRTLVENIPQKIFTKDSRSVYVSCNEKFASDLGITPEEITGKTDYDFFPKELADKYRSDDRRIMKSGETKCIEEQYIQDGEKVWVYTVKTPLRDKDGNTVGILGVFSDITERRQAEEALRERKKELEFKTQNLAEANIALKVLLKRRDEDKAELEEKILCRNRLLHG